MIEARRQLRALAAMARASRSAAIDAALRELTTIHLDRAATLLGPTVEPARLTPPSA